MAKVADNTSDEAPRGSLPLTAYATLGLLLPYERFTAVEVQERAYQQLRHFYWAPALSHVRRELNRLDDLGLVDALVVQQGRIKRTLKYTITELGAKVLAEWAERPESEPLVVKNAVLLRLWLGRRASNSPAVLHALEDHMARMRSELELLKEQMRGVDERFQETLLALNEYKPSEAGDLRRIADRTSWHRAVMRYCERNYENELANSAALLEELSQLTHH